MTASAFVDAKDLRLRDNLDGTFTVYPGSYNSWTVSQVYGHWGGVADHGEYASGVDGNTLDDVLRQLLGQPLTQTEYFAGVGLTESQQRLMDAVSGLGLHDMRVALDQADAPAADKAAVAERLGVPGEGDRYAHPQAYSRREAARLVEKIERGIAVLEAEAAEPAKTLAERGYPNADAEEWGKRKRDSILTAQQYAEDLWQRVDAGGQLTPVDQAEAEKVALATQMGGILIDGSRWADPANQSPWTSDEERAAITKHYQDKAAAVEGSGAFTYVAEPGQLPFWHLGHADQSEGNGTRGRDGAAAGQNQEEQQMDSNTYDNVDLGGLNLGFPGGGFTGSGSGTGGGGGSQNIVINGSFQAGAVSYGDGAEAMGTLHVNSDGQAADDCAEA